MNGWFVGWPFRRPLPLVLLWQSWTVYVALSTCESVRAVRLTDKSSISEFAHIVGNNVSVIIRIPVLRLNISGYVWSSLKCVRAVQSVVGSDSSSTAGDKKVLTPREPLTAACVALGCHEYRVPPVPLPLPRGRRIPILLAKWHPFYAMQPW